MTTQELTWHDLQHCLRRAPVILLAACKKFGPELIVSGGYVRACSANEEVNDIDCFTSSEAKAREIANYLQDGERSKYPIHESPNALTITGYRVPIQIVFRWVFKCPEDCVESFDFTISRAAFWWSKKIVPAAITGDGTVLPETDAGHWDSLADTRYYPDLAGKRLCYCAPQRNEDAGGSLLRVLKYYQRGYRIPLDDFGAVIARMMMGVRTELIEKQSNETDWYKPVEIKLAAEITKQLRVVDPEIDPRHISHLPSQNNPPKPRQ